MAKIQHFKDEGQKWGFSVVDGNVRVFINLDRFSEQFIDAQHWLGEQVLQGCRAHMPLRTGGLQQRSRTEKGEHLREEAHTENGGRRVVFPGPYARFQYMGEVMVDPDTNSPWARKGVKKVLAGRPLNYSNPEATSHWFDTAKAQNGEAWISGVKKIAGGGKAP